MNAFRSLTNKVKKFLPRLRQNEKGQGATEYILLLVVLIGLVLMFKGRIQTFFKGKMDVIDTQGNNFTADAP